VGNTRRKTGAGLKRFSLAILLSMMVLGSTAANTLNGSEDLGKIVQDLPPPGTDPVDGDAGQIDPNY